MIYISPTKISAPEGRDKHNIKCRWPNKFCWMKKRTTTKIPQQPWQILLCFPSYLKRPSTSHSHLLKFSNAFSKVSVILPAKRNSSSSRWPQHVVWSLPQSTTHLLAYSSQKWSSTWNPHSCWRQQVFTHFWVPLSPIDSSTLSQPWAWWLKLKHGFRSLTG